MVYDIELKNILDLKPIENNINLFFSSFFNLPFEEIKICEPLINKIDLILININQFNKELFDQILQMKQNFKA